MRRVWEGKPGAIRALPSLLAALLAAGAVLAQWGTPLREDALFWWVPAALRIAEEGPWLAPDALPAAALPGQPLPPQWAGGLPDYGHPPLWYAWMALHIRLLPLPVHQAVHAAALVPAAALGAGLVTLARRLGGDRAAWGAVALPLMPPVAALMGGADTDLPLLALTPWALAALLDRADARFALLAALATACKEPGVLLAAPALVAMIQDRRWSWAWLAPPLTLGAWAALHWLDAGWGLAQSERLPDSLGAWLRDLGAVAWIVGGAQGRLLLVGGAALALRRRGAAVVAAHVLVQICFFGTMNFLGGVERADASTHVRYLLPAMAGLGPLGVAGAPLLALPLGAASVWTLRERSPWGAEASLFGLDQARATAAAAPAIAELPGPTWVGSYAWTQLTRPFSGAVQTPIPGLRLYAFGTDPGEVEGYVVETAEGEPLGRLQELDLRLVEEIRVGEAWVRLHAVQQP